MIEICIWINETLLGASHETKTPKLDDSKHWAGIILPIQFESISAAKRLRRPFLRFPQRPPSFIRLLAGFQQLQI